LFHLTRDDHSDQCVRPANVARRRFFLQPDDAFASQLADQPTPMPWFGNRPLHIRFLDLKGGFVRSRRCRGKSRLETELSIKIV